MNGKEIVATTADAAFAVDLEGRVIAWNQAAEQHLGYLSAEVVGRFCWQVLRGRDLFSNIYCDRNCPVRSMALKGEPIHGTEVSLRNGSGVMERVAVSTLVVRRHGREEIVHLVHRPSVCNGERVGDVSPFSTPNVTSRLSPRELEVLARSPSFIPDGPECNTDGTPDTMTFDATASNLSSGIAVWTGTTTLTWVSGGPYVQTLINTRFTETVTNMAGAPLSLTAAGVIAGMPSAVGGVLEVTGDFKSKWFLEAQAPDTGLYEPAYDMFDRLLTQGSIHYNVGGGFYFTYPLGSLIFYCDFETGDLSDWSGAVH